MFNGHVDVVPPGDAAAWASDAPFSGRITGDVLYGRGGLLLEHFAWGEEN